MTEDVKGASVSQRLAAWISGVTVADVPGNVRDQVVATAVDTVGLSLSARHEGYAVACRDSWDADGPCTVLGHERRLDAGGAAFVNGVAAHGEDFDNTFEGCPVHSGAVIVPAILALAERDGLSGAQVMASMAVGIEIICRLGLVAQKGVHAGGFHPTSVLGTMAAAGACGHAMGLNVAQLTHAFGIAGSASSGIIEYLADGSSTKRFHAGWAAQAGLRAAMLARAGFDGPRTVFEGTHGLYKSFAPSLKADFAPIVDALGSRWVAADLAFKPYACGTMTQPFIDAALALRAQGVAPEDIASITCEVGEGTVHRLWAPLALKQAPPTAYGAKFSTPYCIAVALVDGDAGLAQFTEDRIADPRILALAAKVTYVVDPANEYPRNYTGHVRATLNDGRVVETRQPCLRGGAQQPLSQSEILAKYRANTRFAAVPDAVSEALLQALLGLGGLADFAVLRGATMR
ncbi:MmgE/PrpD family protein [Humitalea sp. 24SJ18S-53]|uniref:MmgE/PrpD family protein n=1 Tax=Humitalea sp. 24SJ18S-53 TaxID=3422307 RepID=UPI003D66DD00